MKGQVCRVCGCTDDEACPEGCYWIAPDLCSACDGTPGAAAKGTIRGLRAAITRIRHERDRSRFANEQLRSRILLLEDKKC